MFEVFCCALFQSITPAHHRDNACFMFRLVRLCSQPNSYIVKQVARQTALLGLMLCSHLEVYQLCAPAFLLCCIVFLVSFLNLSRYHIPPPLLYRLRGRLRRRDRINTQCTGSSWCLPSTQTLRSHVPSWSSQGLLFILDQDNGILDISTQYSTDGCKSCVPPFTLYSTKCTISTHIYTLAASVEASTSTSLRDNNSH